MPTPTMILPWLMSFATDAQTFNGSELCDISDCRSSPHDLGMDLRVIFALVLLHVLVFVKFLRQDRRSRLITGTRLPLCLDSQIQHRWPDLCKLDGPARHLGDQGRVLVCLLSDRILRSTPRLELSRRAQRLLR